MLGELEEDLKEFDVTKPFIIARRPSKPTRKAKGLVLTQRTKRNYDFDAILRRFQKSQQSHSGVHSEESLQGTSSRTMQEQDDYQTFYLQYLEYFVSLIVNYSTPRSGSKVQQEASEAEKMQALESKITCTVLELLKKYVRGGVRVEYIVQEPGGQVEVFAGSVQILDTDDDGVSPEKRTRRR